MYLRPVFRQTDPATIDAMIRANPFGQLVTVRDGALACTHLPFTLRREGDALTVFGHLAAANPHCAALDGGEGLAVFTGPHAYIAPGWYAAQPSVPTWDYVAVHLTGRLEPVADEAEVTEMLAELGADDPAGFDVRALPDAYRRQMYSGIRAFRLQAERVEAQWKMSQNRSVEDRRRVIAALRAQGQADVAALIEATLPA